MIFKTPNAKLPMKNRRSQNLDLNLLKIFIVTYQEKNLKKAALRLSSTAPSISIKLSKLKDKIGGELFFKTPTGFEPTKLADELFVKVDPILSNLTDTIDFLGGFEAALIEDPITMDIGQHLMPWLAPVLYEEFRVSSPNTHFIANYFTSNSVERLRKGIVNIGVQLKDITVPSDILEFPIGHSNMVAIVRKDHPYPHDAALMRDLVEYDFAIIEQSLSELGKGGRFLSEMRKLNIALNIKFRSPSVYAICDILKRTDMVCPTSHNLWLNNPNEFRAIKILDFPDLVLHPVCAYIHQKNRHSEKHLWLLELIKSEFVGK